MKKFLYNLNRDLEAGDDLTRFITLLGISCPCIILVMSNSTPVSFFGMLGYILIGVMRVSYAEGRFDSKENK